MQPKLLGTFALLWILLVGLVGCSSPATPRTTREYPFKGKSLTIAVPDDDLANLLTTYTPAWRSREKLASLDVVNYSDRRDLGKAKADLWVVPVSALPTLVEGAELRRVPPKYLEGDNPFGWGALLGDWREQFLLWRTTDDSETVPYGLPILGEAPLCFHRSDLFGDAKHRQAFEIEFGRPPDAPETWRDYLDAAKYFAKALGKPSLPPLPASDADVRRLFEAIAAGYLHRRIGIGETLDANELEKRFGFYFDLRTGEPTIDSEAFVRAAEVLKETQSYRPTKRASNPETAFEDGNAVLAIGDARWVGSLQRSSIRNKFDIRGVPGGEVYFEGSKAVARNMGNRVPFLGSRSWVGVVPKSTAHPEAAFDLLASMANQHTSGEIVREPRWAGGLLRSDQFDQRMSWDSLELDPKTTARFERALDQTLNHAEIKNPAYVLRIPNADSYLVELESSLADIVTGKKEAKAALSEVRAKWDALIAKTGKKNHLDHVRISRGLLPK